MMMPQYNQAAAAASGQQMQLNAAAAGGKPGKGGPNEMVFEAMPVDAEPEISAAVGVGMPVMGMMQ